MSLEFVLLGPAVVTAAGAALSLATSILQKRLQQRRGETLEERVERLTTSLKSASDLVSEIEGEVKKRSELASKLQADIARYNELKQLDAKKVEAVSQALRAEITKESSKSFWVGFAENFLFFLAGVVVSYWLAKYVH